MKLSSLAVRDPIVARFNPPHQVPIFAASSFVFDGLEEGMRIFDGEQPGHVYGRFGNPTVDAAAAKIAALEAHGLEEPAYGLFTSSGMAAIATVLLGICQPGDTVLTSADLYGGTVGLIRQLESRGIRKMEINLRDEEAVEDALSGDNQVSIIYVETPSNPTLRCTDLGFLSSLAHHYDALIVVDNTFATPLSQLPLSCGADVVVHSTTKYLNGHGTGVAGAIVCTDEELYREKFIPTYRLYGGNGNPWDAWLVLNGLKTLPLRMKAHSRNAAVVADHLDCHKLVTHVNYPGLKNHPDREVVDKQMLLHGGMLSFELSGGLEAVRHFMKKIEFCTLTPTLGDVDTLVLHPATMSHRGLDPAVRRAHGITDGLVRMSVGIEDVEDILEDVDRALRK